MAGRYSSPPFSSTSRREEKHDGTSSNLLDQFYAHCNGTNHNLQNRTPPPPQPQRTFQTPGVPSSLALNWQQESHLKAEIAEAKRTCQMLINGLRQRSADPRLMGLLESFMKFLNRPDSYKCTEKFASIKKWLNALFQKAITARKQASSSLTSGQSSSSNMLSSEARHPHRQTCQSLPPVHQESLHLTRKISQVSADSGHGKSVQPPVGTFQGSVVSNGFSSRMHENVPNQSTTTISPSGFVPTKRGRPGHIEKSGGVVLVEKEEKKVQKCQGMQDVKVKQETQQQVLQQKPAPQKAVMHSQIKQMSATQPPSSFISEMKKAREVSHHDSAATVLGRKETDQPFRHLVNLVQLVSEKALRASVGEIWSMVNLSDRTPGATKMNRWFDVVSPNPSSLFDADRSTASIERNQALQEEVRAINQRLVDTDVAIIPDGNARTIMKCSFNGVSISPMILQQPIEPLKLLVPTNYPDSSPVFLETLPVEMSGEDDLSVKAKSRLNRCLRSLLQPVTLEDIARSWDVCARQVITEYALQNGGGSFSSQYGTWETVCSDAAY